VTWFIFIGDLVVMAGLIAAAAWVFLRANPADLNAAARIPLDDDSPSRPQAPPPSRPQSVKRAPARSAVIPAWKQESRRQGRQISNRDGAAFESPAAPSTAQPHA